MIENTTVISKKLPVLKKNGKKFPLHLMEVSILCIKLLFVLNTRKNEYNSSDPIKVWDITYVPFILFLCGALSALTDKNVKKVITI